MQKFVRCLVVKFTSLFLGIELEVCPPLSAGLSETSVMGRSG
jgi:hypothetical protein